MKKVIFVLILLCIMAYGHAAENTFTSNDTTKINQKIGLEGRKNFLYLRVTPIVVPGIAVGFTNRFNISQNKVIDLTLAVNYHDLDLFIPGILKSFGVSLITEHFSNSQALGFFSRLNLGAEYINKPSSEEKAGWIPNATMGFGHSMQFNKSSYIRLSLEIGYTAILVRINVEFVL